MIIVDTNILYTYFWETSIFKEITNKGNLSLISTTYALEELKKYSSEIMTRRKLSRHAYDKKIKEINKKIFFVEQSQYKDSLRDIKKQIFVSGLPQDLLKDADFYALASKLNCPIWSNDSALKELKNITVFNTEEMIILMR